MQTTSQTATLPQPSKTHATCAWCGAGFPGIEALIDHVELGHIASRDVALARTPT